MYQNKLTFQITKSIVFKKKKKKKNKKQKKPMEII